MNDEMRQRLQEAWEYLKNKSYSDLRARDAMETVKDAIWMLEKQEPIEPIHAGQYYCGACKFILMSQSQKYCMMCGREVKWDEQA